MVIANSSQRGSSRRRLAPDPMRRRAGPEPHDLLLGMAPAHLPENAPAWVCAALKAGWPVVVRRAPADPARVAIGVRGLAREQRWAGWMPLAAITRRLRPEALGQREPAMLRDLPAWRALRDLRAPLNALGLAWGVTGGAGFELASGVAVLHPDSDLDLLLRAVSLPDRPATADPGGRRGPARMGRGSAPGAGERQRGAAVAGRPLADRGGGGMSVLFAYPGQGAQRPGMLAALPDEPPVRACLEQAADCLGQAPAELESAEALRGTRAVQLCLLIAGVAASRLLETRGHRPGLVAGLSIGAYPAAVVAGALDFDDALRLVALRGELMQAAWPEGYGMSAILGLEQAQLEALILAVRREHPPLYLANVNAERQLVVAGSEAALAALAERARAAGASAAKRLAVSVPSHCALLDEPAARLAEAFAGIRLHRPRVPYLSSSRARLVAEPAALADDLAGNMARRVEWLATLRSAYERGARLHLELPPGRVLSGLARPLFGCATPAFEGSRADTLDALLREEEKRTR